MPTASQAVNPARPRRADGGIQPLRLWIRLLRVQRLVEAGLRDRLRTDFQATLPRFDVMAALERAPEGLSMSKLSRELMVSNGNVTGIVDRLAGDGFVTRSAMDGDRRSSIVRLTEEGRARFAAMARAHKEWVTDLLSDLDADETAAVIGLLDRIIDNRGG